MTPPYQPTFNRLPDDPSGRFQIVREFLLRWHGLDTGAAGRTNEWVGEVEARLKVRLPIAVREWAVLLDDLKRTGGWAHVLRDGLSLDRVPGCDAFSLLVSGEGDRHWGVAFRDFAQEDPPAREFRQSSAGRFTRSRRAAPHTSTWAVEFILLYLHLSPSLQTERSGTDLALARLRAHPPERVVSTRIDGTEVFEFEGGLIHLDRSVTPRALRCYAPYREATNDSYHGALRDFEQRVDALLGAPRA